MKIALAQMNMIYNDQQANYPTIEHFIKEASLKNCDLVVFPEMCTTGFSMDCSLESSVDLFQKWARQYNISILYGEAIEKEGKKYNNAKLVNGKDVLLDYDKIHPFYDEAKYYQSGEHIDICTIEDITLSTVICFDLRFPELFQILSKKAQLIFVIASWPKIRDDHWLTLLKARAIENQCYIVGVNRIGDDVNCQYIGHSVVYDSYGNMKTKLSSEEELIVFEVNLQEIEDSKGMKDIKSQRKEEIYKKLQ